MNTESVQIPYNFYPRDYQIEALSSPNKRKVLVWHRGSGKSITGINALILEAFKAKGTYLYLAPYYSQAKDVIWRNVVFNHIPAGHYSKNEAELTISLSNGSLILFRGCDNPDRLRGISDIKMVLFDEAGFMQDLREIYEKIIQPKAFDAEIWFISTPNGRDYFWELSRNTDFFVSIKNVEDTQVIPAEVIAEIKKNTRPDYFQQEYYCDFTENASGYFSDIYKIVDETLKLRGGDKNGDYHIGVDLASVRDWTVCVAINKQNNHLEGFERFQGTWREVESRVESFIRAYGTSVAYIDATGNGSAVVERLIQKGLPVEPVKFSQQIKLDMLGKLSLAIINQEFKIPKLPILLEELEKFRYQQNEKTKKITLEGQNFSDDCVIALGLAVKELNEIPQGYKEQTINDLTPWLGRARFKKDNTIIRY